jgi:trk system potassium uptake protein TrkA
LNIIIVGCGRVGSQLATLFSQDDNNIVVIDQNASSFTNLSRSFEGTTISGVGFDEDVLIQAGVDECDVLAAVTDEDNANLMISEVANRLFDVPHVLTRLYNPDRENAYMQLGLDYVCGTTLVAEEMYSKVIAGHASHVDTFGDYEILRFAFNWQGDGNRGIRVRDLEREHQVRIIAFERKDGSVNSIPSQESILYQGDIVLACIHRDLVEKYAKYIWSSSEGEE